MSRKFPAPPPPSLLPISINVQIFVELASISTGLTFTSVEGLYYT